MDHKRRAWATDDWLAVVFGLALLGISLGAVWLAGRSSSGGHANPAGAWWGKPEPWSWAAASGRAAEGPAPAASSNASQRGGGSWRGVVGSGLTSCAAFLAATRLQGGDSRRFARAFLGLWLLTWGALAIAAERTVNAYGLEYALWALAAGLLVGNTLGLPAWLQPAARTELYIKTGLVLYGAKVLFSRLMELGGPGMAVAWGVTPVVLAVTYWFGQRVLKIPSRTLNIVVSADMAVCGVSAAIATAAACRAKKEELSLAVGISLAFTVLMMLAMPPIVRALALSPQVGGAWIGGTIDSTAAVLAAGQALGDEAAEVAIAIKMIQNMLIGVVALGVALYWVRYVDGAASPDRQVLSLRGGAAEIWSRFPKFVLGFLAASAVFSALYRGHPQGKTLVDAVVKQGTASLETWFFALAFVSIGLESDFRVLGKYLRGGKPVLLYVCGQTLNLALTLTMASLVFGEPAPSGRAASAEGR